MENIKIYTIGFTKKKAKILHKVVYDPENKKLMA